MGQVTCLILTGQIRSGFHLEIMVGKGCGFANWTCGALAFTLRSQKNGSLCCKY